MTGLRLSRIWQCSILRARAGFAGGLFLHPGKCQKAIRRGFSEAARLWAARLSCRASFRWMKSGLWAKTARPASGLEILFMAPCATAFRAVATGQAILAAKRFCADAACSLQTNFTSASLTMPKRAANAVANGKKNTGSKTRKLCPGVFPARTWNWACWQNLARCQCRLLENRRPQKARIMFIMPLQPTGFTG